MIGAGIFLAGTCACAQEISYKWERITPKYETADAFVAALNVLDYGADPTGVVDQTALFQRLLDFLGSRTNTTGLGNGGILYIPEGKYYFRGRLIIPKGVTVRGDWEKPIKGQPIKGTVLMVTVGRNSQNEGTAFLTLQPCAAVKDVVIWYPNQTADNIVPYPPSILFGSAGFWGNDYCHVSHVTLVNAYDGVIFSRTNGGGAPNIYGLYGTPLSRGIEIDNIAEVGRIDDVDFSPDYWAGSGFPNSPSVDGAHKKWIYENGTGVVMRRNDWSYACNVRVNGYNKGYHMAPSIPSVGASPNGHNWGFQLANCKYGVFVEAVDNVGQMHTGYKITNCEYGFYLERNPSGVLQILGCEIDATKSSVFCLPSSATKIQLNQCTVLSGKMDLWGGIATVMDCDFSSVSPQIELGANIRAIITGNRFPDDYEIRNTSLYKCIVDHTPMSMVRKDGNVVPVRKLPVFPYVNQFEFHQQPTGSAFILATENGVSTAADDNSAALQGLLNQAGEAGGGLVFLPPGKYNFRNPIIIPAGVELQGSVDVGCQPMGPGSVLEVYTGKGAEAGTPFITMERNSGLRGLVIDYPEQTVKILPDIPAYPYTIRGNADVYIVNVGLRAAYHGIDFFTNKCDNHFVDYLSGHVFRTGVRVGGGTENGHIYNVQFNPITYGNGGETKFGSWPNSPVDQNNPDKEKEHNAAYAYEWTNLDFFVLGDCKNQILYNDFFYDAHRGIRLISENGNAPGGLSLGLGIDAAIQSFNVEAVAPEGFDFINSQIVTVNGGNTDNNAATRYIRTGTAFAGEVTLFGADFWGQAYQIANEIQSGTITLQSANYAAPGQQIFASVASAAEFNLIGSNINPINTLLSSGSISNTAIQSSSINLGNLDSTSFLQWLNNLGHSSEIDSESDAFIPRDGWIVTASSSNDNAPRTLDGDNATYWNGGAQKPGQWFMVDMRQQAVFNGIYLYIDAARYYPASYKIYVSNDETNWTQVASGTNAGYIQFDSQQAQYIKVEQIGSSTNQWRIAEFYVLNAGSPPVMSLEKPLHQSATLWYENGQLSLEGLEGYAQIRIHTLSGKQLFAQTTDATHTSVSLDTGIYIAVIENNGQTFHKKIIVK
jgi:hypothetical protein